MAVNDEIPKSRITLTYRTQVNGEPVDKVLPFRMLIMGNFSRGTSVDQKQDLDKRQIRNLNGKNLNQLMKDMNMSLELKNVKSRLTTGTVDTRLDKDSDEDSGEALPPFTLPIKSMKSFTPAEIAESIPKVKALLQMRKLLLEVQANLDNYKEFRTLIRQLTWVKDDKKTEAENLAMKNEKEALKKKLEEDFTKRFGDQFNPDNFKLPALPKSIKDKEKTSEQDD
jgi:type VI secretion system protein ImpB